MTDHPQTTGIPLNVLDAACAAHLAAIEGRPAEDAARLWNDWRLSLAEKGDKAAIEALAEDRAAMSAALKARWQPIETAPKSFRPPLSFYNHHAPNILGLWGQSFYCVCSWGGPSQPFWINGDNKKVPFQPTYWMPLPEPP